MYMGEGMLRQARAPREWQVGDAPEEHPLWEEQVELEMDMLQRGVENYRARVAKSRDRGELTRLIPVHREMEKMVAALGPGLTSWLKRAAKSRGARPVALFLLEPLDPYVCAFITCRTVLDGLLTNKTAYLGLAQEVGLQVEHEARMQAWVALKPGLFYDVQGRLHRQHATVTHKRRVNIHQFNALIKEDVEWENWTTDARRHVGFTLIELMARSTGKVVIEREDNTNSSSYHVHGDDGTLLEDLAHSINLDELKHPQHLPTLMPPKRWDGVKRGGYYTPILRVPTLIRFHADNEEHRDAALDEYNALDLARPLSALHYVQETPWRVNQRVLQVVMEAWDKDYGIAGLARREPIALPPRPSNIDDDEETLRAWKYAASHTYGENARRVSNASAASTTIAIAERLWKREFYFPHMLDFRGRMYPIPIYLQPQGTDLARGLLTFAKGKAVGPEGAGWLAVHLANCWGADKGLSFDARIAWVEAREALWRRISKDPLRNREWCAEGQDDPWQSLAAIFEWVRFLEEGADMVSSLPVRVDGTCNGIQHLSALMRDEQAGAAVNLCPSDAPRDIYKDVAGVLQTRLETIEDGGGDQGRLAQMWLDGFDRDIPRSFTKTPVMVLPYGGTRQAYFDNTYEWLNKYDKSGTKVPQEARREAVPWLVTHLWDAVSSVVVSGRLCMEWLKTVARVLAKCDMPIVWRTPSGFVVRHFYGKLKRRRIESKVDGRVLYLVTYERTKALAVREQLQGISPNFVHSMDASANTETIIRMALRNDQPPFTSIHDSFGTTAGSMWDLFHTIRYAFQWVYREDALEEFRRLAIIMYRDYLLAVREGLNLYSATGLAEETIPRLPERGTLDLSQVADSDYFFA